VEDREGKEITMKKGLHYSIEKYKYDPIYNRICTQLALCMKRKQYTKQELSDCVEIASKIVESYNDSEPLEGK